MEKKSESLEYELQMRRIERLEQDVEALRKSFKEQLLSSLKELQNVIEEKNDYKNSLKI